MIVAIEMFTAFFIAMSAPFYMVYATKVIALSEVQWGLLMFMSGLLGIMVVFPMCSIVDRIGLKKMILLGIVMVPFFIFGFRHANGFYAVAVVLCGIVLCNNIMIPAFSTLIANTVPRNRRGRLYSIIGERGISINFGNFWGGGFLIFQPAALGALTGGYIYKMNPAYPWMITSVALLISMILVYLFVHEPEEAQK